MVVPRRFLAYAVSCLILVWTVGFWVLTTTSLNKGSKMPTVEERTSILQNKIASVERAIHEQVAENKRLLNLLKPQDGHMNAALPSPALDTIPVLKNAASSNSAHDPIVILVFACNRAKAIQSHLDQIFRLRPSAERFPVIVSQDCDHQDTANVIKSYGDKLTLIRQPDQSEIKPPPKLKKFVGYYKIARHYGWALNQTFNEYKYKYAILTEDDLDLAVDFFEYFSATKSLLDSDPTLWCVSAWNDNGKGDKIETNPELLYRTDFFPGLGWMLTNKLWAELSPIWPSSFWDDWMRLPEQRKDRACIRPEVSRTSMSTNGKGVVLRQTLATHPPQRPLHQLLGHGPVLSAQGSLRRRLRASRLPVAFDHADRVAQRKVEQWRSAATRRPSHVRGQEHLQSDGQGIRTHGRLPSGRSPDGLPGRRAVHVRSDTRLPGARGVLDQLRSQVELILSARISLSAPRGHRCDLSLCESSVTCA